MATLTERIDVRCPHHFLIHHTERYFTVHRRGQTPGTFGLTVDMSRVGLPGKVQARHDVHVRYKISKDAAGHDTIDLTWDPDDRFVPSFTGSLSGIRTDDGMSDLTLEGTYEAPFGAIGAVFDAVLGRRIAAATAQAVLHDIKQFVEADYQVALSTSLAESPKE
jgi:hypothetical protein